MVPYFVEGKVISSHWESFWGLHQAEQTSVCRGGAAWETSFSVQENIGDFSLFLFWNRESFRGFQ